MNPQPPSPESNRPSGRPGLHPPGRVKPHWIVGTHRLMRSLSFAHAFVFVGAHLWAQGHALWVWLLLGLQFLVYPQLAYLRARAAPDSQKAELQNLLFDCLLVGIWVATLGFPLWIGFTLFISTTINNAISNGKRGVFQALMCFAGGVLLGGLATGFVVTPEQSPAVTVLCVLGLSWYLLSIGQVAYARTLTLRAAREKLKGSELALQHANDALRLRLVEIEMLRDKLREQANRDALTGLFNRRYLEDTLARELSRCDRLQQPLAVIMIDIDHFKRINDTHGHPTGDQVLVQLGKLLNGDARQADVACRYGGEEFLMLLPGMGLEAAVARAEEWRQVYSMNGAVLGGQRLPLTLSIGVAMFPEHATTGDHLTRCADMALYQAKAQGRDGVVVYSADVKVLASAA